MGGKHHSLIDDEEEGEGDEDVHMYPADMYPDEQDGYREAVRASKAVHDVFSKLDPNAEGLCNFGNEVN